VVLRLLKKLAKLTPKAVVHLVQSFVGIIAFSRGDDRVTPINVQNSFNFLGVFSLVENDFDDLGTRVEPIQLGKKLLGPGP